LKTLSAGSEIDAWCTKCKLDLGHRIIAMVEDRPKRVVCQTCGSQHNYRAPKTLTTGVRIRKVMKSAAPKSPSARAKAENDRQVEWERRIAGNTLESFKRYTIDKIFEPDDLVTHKKFGEGYVVDVLDPKKVTIMFKDGIRTLAQGQG
jgi:hypothetical protein